MRNKAITVYFNKSSGYLFVPQAFLIKNGLRIDIDPVNKVDTQASCSELGMNILNTMKISEEALPVAEKNRDVLRKASGIKSFQKFSEIFRCIMIEKSENFEICEWIRDNTYGVFMPSKTQKILKLSLDSTPEELGNALLRCLADDHSTEITDEWKINLFNGAALYYKAPSDSFLNVGDAHTDAYQVYEYDYLDGREASMGFYYAAKYEPLNAESVKKRWEKYYGKLLSFEFLPINHAVFKYIAKAETETNIISSCFFQDNEVWCEFLLDVNKSKLSPQQIENIIFEYNTVKESCVIK